MILVDSSVWIDYLRGRRTPQAEKLDALLGSTPLAIGDLILTEVPQGCPTQRQFDQVRELLFGHEKRRTDQTFVDLRAEVSQQIEALRAEMRQHVDTLTNCLIDLEHTSEKRRLSSISDIGKAIADLGASIQTMGARKTDE